jgi:hypothetical protein
MRVTRSAKLLKPFALTIICLCALIPPAKAATESYSLEVESGIDTPLGWPFQNKTVGDAFPNPGASTTLSFWNSVSNQWGAVISWDEILGWSNPNYVITNGVGFMYTHYTGVAITVTASGTVVTNTSVSLNLVGGHWNLVSDTYPRTNSIGGYLEPYLECVRTVSGGWAQYTSQSLGCSSSVGDVAAIWDTFSNNTFLQGKRTSTVNCTFAPFWQKDPNPTEECHQAWGSFLPPMLGRGRSIWYKPVNNVTWTIPKDQVNCN